jgi:cytochrome c553
MPKHYGEGEMKEEKPKASRKSTGKLSDKQKADLKKHMDKLDMSASEKKSHRMKMMAQMRKGHSIKKAHSSITK